MVTIRRVHLNKLSLKGGNYICMNGSDIVKSKIDVAESELMRILKHIEKPDAQMINGKEQYSLDTIITLKIGKNVKKYEKLMKRKGMLTIVDVDSNGHVIDVATYVSQITGAGHSRSQKSLFIRTDVVNKLDEILRCGISKYNLYAKPSKWNAYYGMSATDSVPVTMPNIVVIDDFKKIVTERCDIVQEYAPKLYQVKNDELTDIEIMPFDGEGLVTPDMARQWAKDIGCSYLPSSFQFRAIPGIKGELFTFDIESFAQEYNVGCIMDIWGKEWDISNDKIDCILTKSQFKFYDQFDSYENWLEYFMKKTDDYQRTFNISDVAEDLKRLKKTMMISYQPLQTIVFTDKEIEDICEQTVQNYTELSTDPQKFIKYRGITVDDNGSHLKDDIPPYYTAMLHNQSLFGDKYIREKVINDISGLKNRILSGKLYVRGNYQILAVDLYALAQYAFNIVPTGLLREGEVYSNYWNCSVNESQMGTEIDIIRNPHINHEHRLCRLANTDEIKKWYKYQETGIIANMYDTMLLALNGADCDGDHVGTVYDPRVIQAVKREIKNGNARTVEFKPYPTNNGNAPIPVNDTCALMEINLRSFKNSIGDVINAITKLWNCDLTQQNRDRIKIMSVIGALTIDFAKTGEAVEIPQIIKDFLKDIKKPYHLRYLEKNKKLSDKEKKSLKNARDFKLEAKNISIFGTEKSNVNRICFYLEERLSDAEFIQPRVEFDFTSLLSCVTNVDRKYRNLALRLQSMYHSFSMEYNMDFMKTDSDRRDCKNHYSFFYRYCRGCLIDTAEDVNKALDMLLTLYYTDKNFIGKSKDILWNAFGEELIQRCRGDFSADINIARIKKMHEKRMKKLDSISREKMGVGKMKTVIIKSIDRAETYFTVEDKMNIQKKVRRMNLLNDGQKLTTKDQITPRRLLAVLIILQRMNDGALTLYCNKPEDLTEYTLSKLINVDHRKIKPAILWLKTLGLIKIDENCTRNISLLVQWDNKNDVDLYRGCDFNEASGVIRRIFR